MKYLQRLKTGEIYFRKGGRTLGRLPGLEGSPEFMSAYRALLAEHGTPVVLGRPSTTIKPRPEPGKSPSIEHFAELWLASVQFAVSDERKTKETYARGTQQNYRMALKLMRQDGPLQAAPVQPDAAQREPIHPEGQARSTAARTQ